MDKTKLLFLNAYTSSPIGIGICDSSEKCIEANDAMCQMVGSTKKEVLAQNYNDLESWKKSGLLKKAKEAEETKKSTNIKITLTTSFGKELTANVRFSPFFMDDESFLLCTFDDLSELKKIEDEREKLINELTNALEEIKTLRSILPQCSYCKKIRDNEGYWELVETYIIKHLSADISHGICPECLKKHFPDIKI